MTDREALKIAFNALVEIDRETPYPIAKHAIKCINAAFNTQAQPEQVAMKQGWDVDTLLDKQEPVAWIMDGELFFTHEYQTIAEPNDGAKPLYTAPPSKPINFLVNGTRYKVKHQGYYGCSIVGLPENLNGQWVALVDATDDKHLQCTAPPSKPWVSLTDEEIDELSENKLVGGKSVNWLARAIEAALRSKNT